MLAAAVFLFPLRDSIGGIGGAAFWVGMTLLASALPVQLPRGTQVSVSFAPLIATMVLGGPAAAGVIALFGTTEWREVRGRVPWYGTLQNHAVLVVSGVLGGVVYELLRTVLTSSSALVDGVLGFSALLLASGAFYAANSSLTVLVVSLRSRTPVRTIWAQDVRGIAPNLLALAPLGWLMAQIFTLPNGVGWWATPLFVVPLFTTRLAYNRYVESRQLFIETVSALANAVDARDRYTHGHSRRVMLISGAMARVMRLSETLADRIEWASLLHDVGKIGIRDNILLKEGPLTPEERQVMNQHPVIGAEIVAPTRQLASEAPLIRAHHEWWNGAGYPDGVTGDAIPLGARIMTAADSYEAMTSSRPYRKIPLTHEQAVAELEKFSGIQFDPQVVPVLIGLDRETLDAKPVSADELVTMRHLPPMKADDESTRQSPAQGSGASVKPSRARVAALGGGGAPERPERGRSAGGKPTLAATDESS